MTEMIMTIMMESTTKHHKSQEYHKQISKAIHMRTKAKQIMMMRESMKAIQTISTIVHPRMGTFQTKMKAIHTQWTMTKSPLKMDPQVTINDINLIEEMNTTQIHNNNTNEEAIENNSKWTTVANNNRYNLRPRPANRGNMYTLIQNNQQSAHMAIPKPHAHVMLMQMNVRTKHYLRN